MELLVVGTIAFDTVETPFGKRNRTLGGSATFLANAASYFCKPLVVGVVGEDFDDKEFDFLRERQVDTTGVSRLPGKTFAWSGYYDTDLNVAHTRETQLNVLESFDPVVPEAYRSAKVVMLGNIAPELQTKVLDQMSDPAIVAADTMNFWIEGSREALLKTLKRVDVLSINDAETRQISGEYNLVKAAQAIRSMGPQTLIVKRGEHGATLFTADGVFMVPAFPIMTISDPTGAGDSFAGGMMGYLARRGETSMEVLRQAIVMGSTMASFAVEDFSLDRFRSLKDEEVKARFAEFRQISSFEVSGTTMWQ